MKQIKTLLIATFLFIGASQSISAQSKIEKLLKGVACSQVDWRDTLMGAGLEKSNWHTVAKEAGIDVA